MQYNFTVGQQVLGLITRPKLLTGRNGITYTKRVRYTEKSFEQDYFKPTWKNNEQFEILETPADPADDFDYYKLHKMDKRDWEPDALVVPNRYFKEFFIINNAMTFHKIQGMTIEKPICINLADSLNYNGADYYLTRDELLRRLYVACSRVRIADNIRFYLGTDFTFDTWKDKVDALAGHFSNNLARIGKSNFLSQENVLKILIDIIRKEETTASSRCIDIASRKCSSRYQTNTELANEIGITRQTLEAQIKKLGFWYTMTKRRIPIESIGQRLIDRYGAFEPPACFMYSQDMFTASLDADNAVYRTLNKIKYAPNEKGTVKREENAELKRLLFECDNTPDEEQLGFVERNKDIIKECVFSGNESYHCIVELEVSLGYGNDKDALDKYKWLFRHMNTTRFNGKADKSCAEPSRWTRMPGAIRPETGNEQKLIYTTDHIIKWQDYEKAYQSDKDDEDAREMVRSLKARHHTSGNTGWKHYVDKAIKGMDISTGHRNGAFCYFAGIAKSKGWNVNEVLDYANTYIQDDEDCEKVKKQYGK
jgi:hypothetical protein